MVDLGTQDLIIPIMIVITVLNILAELIVEKEVAVVVVIEKERRTWINLHWRASVQAKRNHVL